MLASAQAPPYDDGDFCVCHVQPFVEHLRGDDAVECSRTKARQNIVSFEPRNVARKSRYELLLCDGIRTVIVSGKHQTLGERMALKNAGLVEKDIDFIVFATITPDYFFPGSGVLLQRELGLESIGALDIRNACSGFIYALSTADQFIKSGMYKTIPVSYTHLTLPTNREV